jgi:hypothetical protein
MFAILKCPTCGRVFPYYGDAERVACPKHNFCGTTITISSESVIPITFETPNKVPDKMRNWARIYVNAFNNTVYLAAEVWSEDGYNSIIVSLFEAKLGITHNEVLAQIPTEFKYQSAYDGLIVRSGRYSLSGGDTKLADKIGAQYKNCIVSEEQDGKKNGSEPITC